MDFAFSCRAPLLDWIDEDLPLSAVCINATFPLYIWNVFTETYYSILGLCYWSLTTKCLACIYGIIRLYPWSVYVESCLCITGLYLWSPITHSLTCLSGILPSYLWSVCVKSCTLSLACIFEMLPPYHWPVAVDIVCMYCLNEIMHFATVSIMKCWCYDKYIEKNERDIWRRWEGHVCLGSEWLRVCY